MKLLKTVLALASAAVMLCLPAAADSIIPYENYTYSETDKSVVPGPQAYVGRCTEKPGDL